MLKKTVRSETALQLHCSFNHLLLTAYAPTECLQALYTQTQIKNMGFLPSPNFHTGGKSLSSSSGFLSLKLCGLPPMKIA